MSEIHRKPTHDKLPTLYYTGRRKREGPSEVLAHTSEGAHPLDPCLGPLLKGDLPLKMGWGEDPESTHRFLSLSLLYDWAEDAHFAEKHYEAFARDVISPIPYGAWSLRSTTILSYFCVGTRISVQDKTSEVDQK